MKIYNEIIVPLLEILRKPKAPSKIQPRKEKLTNNKPAASFIDYNEYYKSGTLKLKSGKIPEAIDDFDSALSINSSFHQGYFNRGFAKLKLDDLSGAILDFSSSIEFSQRNAKAFFYRGISYYKAGDKKEAAKDFYKAIEIDPSYKTYLKRNASGNGKSENIVHSASENISGDNVGRTSASNEAIEEIKTNSGNIKEPEDPALSFQDKSFTLKDDMLPSSIDKQGKDPMIVFAIMQYEEAFSKYEEGDKPGALEKFSEALKYNPKFSEAFADRGRLKSELGESNGAIEDYTKAIECDPKYAQAYFYRSRELFKLSQLRDSLVDCSRAIKFNSNYGQAYLFRSIIKKALGNNRSASEDLIKASQLGACDSEELCANGPLKSDS
ncbi:MAG: tetratricopeptide repeat protein [Bacteroidota bacterium]|nr:tetratricopeptide repeat protein [Bacteroidota bacterium]